MHNDNATLYCDKNYKNWALIPTKLLESAAREWRGNCSIKGEQTTAEIEGIFGIGFDAGGEGI